MDTTGSRSKTRVNLGRRGINLNKESTVKIAIWPAIVIVRYQNCEANFLANSCFGDALPPPNMFRWIGVTIFSRPRALHCGSLSNCLWLSLLCQLSEKISALDQCCGTFSREGRGFFGRIVAIWKLFWGNSSLSACWKEGGVVQQAWSLLVRRRFF